MQVDKVLLETCKGRLASSLAALQPEPLTQVSSAEAIRRAQEALGGAESLLAKQQAAAETIQRRAESASRDLAKQQEEMSKMLLQGVSGEAGSNRQKKDPTLLGGQTAIAHGQRQGQRTTERKRQILELLAQVVVN
jgi:hypothetical protein